MRQLILRFCHLDFFEQCYFWDQGRTSRIALDTRRQVRLTT